MHVAVLGAGVIGVTTAWYLRQAGFAVTVLEREPAAALQTSFANGGQISVSHATPWANPGTPAKAFKWLLREDAPLLFRLRADKAQLKWALQFLQQCSAKHADANLIQMLNLGLYSRAALQQLRQDLGIEYQQQLRGILHFYTSASEFKAAVAPTKRMQALGCERHMVSIDHAISLEPALAPIAHKLVGATYTSQDESGNAHLFTKLLAQLCEQAGVQFLYDTDILSLTLSKLSTLKSAHYNDKAPHIDTVRIQTQGQSPRHLQADNYVVALGSYSPLLTKPLGVSLPIFPAKGYSATYQVNPDAPHLAPFVSLIDDEFKLVTSRLGDTLRVAGTAEFNGYNLSLNRVRCQAITQRVQQLFGQGVMTEAVDYWTGLRPMTPSNVPLIGRAHLGQVQHGSGNRSHSAANTDNRQRKFSNLWLNTGHGTLGWTHACGSAKALSLLMQGITPEVDFDFVATQQ